jgi:hypothetical protein
MKILVLFLVFQYLPSPPLPKDETSYNLNPQQQELLSRDWRYVENAFHYRDNANFHRAWHKWWTDCREIMKDNKIPDTAVCDRNTIHGKDAK